MKRENIKEMIKEMVEGWIVNIKNALFIAEKDVKIYFLKAPNLIFGIFLPVVLYFAFAIGRAVEITIAIPGLVAMAMFFGTGAIQSVSLPLERRTGTFKMVLSAPLSLSTIMIGKALAGFFYGLLLSSIYSVMVFILVPISNLFIYIVAIMFSSFLFSAFGLLLSVPFRDIPQAMPPAIVVRIAMVFLCGVFVPVDTMPLIMQIIAYFLPLTYSVDVLRWALNGEFIIPMLFINLGVQILFIFFFIVCSIKLLEKLIQ
jgi:ABC-2 type transport system permease protein